MHGVFYNIPAADYHKVEALSASGAKLLMRSAAHWRAAQEQPMRQTPNMLLGTVVHGLVLEPETFANEIAVAPKFDKRTTFGKKAAEEFEANASGKLVVDEEMHDRARRIADAVRNHAFVKEELTDDGASEVTFFWEQYGLPCKARMDYVRGSSIFDLKTCQDASPEGFARQIANFSYHAQAAHYMAGYRETSGWDADRFVFIAVETEPPYATGVYMLDPPALQSGRTMMEIAAARYAQARQGGTFAGYAEEVIELSLPGWSLIDPAFKKVNNGIV